jgi:hypothetical protein
VRYGGSSARIVGLVLYWAAMFIAAASGAIAAAVAFRVDDRLFIESDDRFLIAGLMCAFGAVVGVIGIGCRKVLSEQRQMPM